MEHSAKYAPMVYDENGIPFVLWDEKNKRILISHGSYTTFLVFDELNYEPLPERNMLFHDVRGRIVASYDTLNQTICIKRAKKTHRIPVPGKLTKVWSSLSGATVPK